jgi:hypothetical protein
MRVKALFAAGFCAVAVPAVGAGSAFAGEETGKGDPTGIWGHANSICAFSGQNDGEPPPGRTAEHVQNWGQIPKEVRDEIAQHGEHPGDACNGHTGFFAEP